VCGVVAGSLNDHSTQFRELVNRSLVLMKHRGPDGNGIFLSENNFIGHTLLSIFRIDANDQPVVSNDKRFTISFNGEIFNFNKLANRIGQSSENNYSEAKLILDYYSKYKEKCLDFFDGFFAFVIYDSFEKSFFYARDRLGIKPLYFFYDGSNFLISSEIKVLLSFEINVGLNHEVFDEFLVFGNLSESKTFYHNILNLNPGYYGVFNVSDKKNKIFQWWKPFDNLNNDDSKLVYDIGKIESTLISSISEWSQSDVPLSIMQSGGVDSGLINHFLSVSKDVSINAFTLVWDEQESNDEMERAIELCAKTNSSLSFVKTNPKSFIERIEPLTEFLSEPISDLNFVSLDILSSGISKEGFKVAICGEGSDEIFAGYERHLQVSQNFRDDDDIILGNNFLSVNRLNYIHGKVINVITDERRLRMRQYSSLDPINKILMMDQLYFLPGYLKRQDHVGMKSSLEIRTPYLSHKLVELVNGISGEKKILNGDLKHILKRISSQYLPKDVVFKKKLRFNAPVSLRNSNLQQFFRKHVNSKSCLSNFFDMSKIEELNSENFQLKPPGHENTLQRFLFLELFLRRFS
jgi:asparagine synthase (glutamine-hydrolysing)